MGVVKTSVTEENERRDAGLPGTPSDADAGEARDTRPAASGNPSRRPRKARRSSGLADVRSLLAGNAALFGRRVKGRAARELRKHGRKRVAAAGAAGLAVVALVIWLAAATIGGNAPAPASTASPAAASGSATPTASRGALPLEGVGALDFQLGDCFKDFNPEDQESTIVACDSGHSAQLVAVQSYQGEDKYPGREQLKEKALGVCKDATLLAAPADVTLSFKLAYPSSTSWDKGDRRVDCYVVAEAGNVMMTSLLP